MVHAVVRSEFALKFFASHLHVSQNLGKKSATNRLISMNGDNRAASIRMPKKMVTPLDPNHFKSESTESLDQLET